MKSTFPMLHPHTDYCSDQCGHSAPAPQETPAQQKEFPLLPCPFCRRDAKTEEFFIDDDPTPWYVATCVICPIKTYDQTTSREATRIWNTRHRDPAFQKLVEAAQSMLDWADQGPDSENYPSAIAIRELREALRLAREGEK